MTNKNKRQTVGIGGKIRTHDDINQLSYGLSRRQSTTRVKQRPRRFDDILSGSDYTGIKYSVTESYSENMHSIYNKKLVRFECNKQYK